MQRLVFAILWFALSVAAPAAAQAPAASEASAGPLISSRTTGAEDQDIAARISGIYAEIPGLQSVEVQVSAGVVILQGSVATPDE
ncbi:MAG: hypothetical protein KKA45_09205, partial [Alphaproteobacteria bacterium]|nr:hypothetical protein [Alphaproteobacteria bacterium]